MLKPEDVGRHDDQCHMVWNIKWSHDVTLALNKDREMWMVQYVSNIQVYYCAV